MMDEDRTAIVVPGDDGSKLIIDALTSGFKQPHQKPWVKGPTITFGIGNEAEGIYNTFESYDRSLGEPMSVQAYDAYIAQLKARRRVRGPTAFRVLHISDETLRQLALYVPLNMYSLVEKEHYGIPGLEANDPYRDFMRMWPVPYTQRRPMCTIAGVFGEIRNLLIVPPDIMRAISVVNHDFKYVYKVPGAKIARIRTTPTYVEAVRAVYKQITRGTKAEMAASRIDKTSAYASLRLELRCMK